MTRAADFQKAGHSPNAEQGVSCGCDFNRDGLIDCFGFHSARICHHWFLQLFVRKVFRVTEFCSGVRGRIIHGGIHGTAEAFAGGTPLNVVSPDFSPSAMPFPPFFTTVLVMRIK
jgi:hypothetical protein